MLDLSQTLIEAKKLRVDYLKTDTHWNMFGGFVACRALVEALTRQMPGLEPLPLDAYDWKPAEARKQGDLATILGETDAYTETQVVDPVPMKPLPAPIVLTDPARFPQNRAKEASPRLTLNEKTSGKAIIFRDSFAGCWYSFLGQHFREVLYVSHYDWDRALIEREKPDVVIDEMLERFFNNEDPRELLKKDDLR
jgi:hypothetical protein